MAKVFKDFEIEEKIGQGGMASVYRGHHTGLNYPVAIKVLHPALTFDESFIARFELEARVAASIQSQNIVKVHDFGVENETYFIVMEFVDGEDMAKISDRLALEPGPIKALPPEICLLILEESAYGLQAAHFKNVLHRDIKPSNIMLDRQGLVRIADFGLARDTDRAHELDLTRTGVVLGTPSYMSPEQANGEKVDHRTDIFSLGVVGYRLLTGMKPFPGNSCSEVQMKIIEADPPPLEPAEFPWITPEISLMLDRALQKDREKRYQSMDQFLQAIRSGLESLDPQGGVALRRRELLSLFAKDPIQCTSELRYQSVQTHLRRGTRYRGMGLEKIKDALLEFRHVHVLDPSNEAAVTAIYELEKEWEESGQHSPPPDQTKVLTQSVVDEVTQVMESSQARRAAGQASAVGAASPEPAGSRPRWPVWAAGIAVVLLLSFLPLLLNEKDDLLVEQEPGMVVPDSVVVAEVNEEPEPQKTEEVPPRPVEREKPVEKEKTVVGKPVELKPPQEKQAEKKPVEEKPEEETPTKSTPVDPIAEPKLVVGVAANPPIELKPADTQQQVKETILQDEPVVEKPEPLIMPKAAPGQAILIFSTEEPSNLVTSYNTLYSGEGAAAVAVNPGGIYGLALVFPESFSRIDLSGVHVDPNTTLDLGLQKPRQGTLGLAANRDFNVTIDGRRVMTSGNNLDMKIGFGYHNLEVFSEGCVVGQILGNGVPLEEDRWQQGFIRYHIQIQENAELQITVEFISVR